MSRATTPRSGPVSRGTPSVVTLLPSEGVYVGGPKWDMTPGPPKRGQYHYTHDLFGPETGGPFTHPVVPFQPPSKWGSSGLCSRPMTLVGSHPT